MKKFKCTVTRTDEYIISLDENVLDEKWIEDWKQVFYNLDSLEEHAEHIAQFRARFGQREIEGYGNPLVNGEKPWFANDDQVNKAINIRVISEDDDIDVDVYELD